MAAESDLPVNKSEFKRFDGRRIDLADRGHFSGKDWDRQGKRYQNCDQGRKKLFHAFSDLLQI